MALDLTGITSHNEYYSQHYLVALMEGDLREVFARWDEAAAARPDSAAHRTPPERLRALAAPYFRLWNRLPRVGGIDDKLDAESPWIGGLLDTLGYEIKPQWTTCGADGPRLPLLAAVNRASGAPHLWVAHALTPPGEAEADPLATPVAPEQYTGDPAGDEPGAAERRAPAAMDWEEIITRHVFSLDEPPRWVLLVSIGQVCLIDRSKWPERRFLSFNLRELFDRRDVGALRATAALLHRENVCPEEGFALLDALDENSHRHAFSVSEDLKDAVRESAELLGNEAVHYLREVAKERLFSEPDQEVADRLTRGCLHYLYRLLFILYLEARPELGYLPVKSEEYLKGYSFEFLRDLELVPLETERDRNGTFFDLSIRILFRLIYDGRDPGAERELGLDAASIRDDFRIAPLKSHLFDPKTTPIISRVKFRNFVLREVIERLSLGKQGRGRRARTGRISYAQLGINQLGAVYENLLSYSGFFAARDLYEVKPAGEDHNPLVHAHFVDEDALPAYKEDERVYVRDDAGDAADNGKPPPKRLLKHEKGRFLYRLAGRNREKTASYYTPESLTRCLVKYALKEVLDGKSANDILDLSVCEMATGSAAFLNEAVDQLADAYLRRKQKETGQSIAHDDYPTEKQRVKMRLADRNVFGVDLNPTAVELAEISLWLNTIYKGAHVPWFGLQLKCGNSLVGCRRETYPASLLREQSGRGGGNPRWTKATPDKIPFTAGQDSAAADADAPALPPRPKHTVYHWLVPDPGMSLYADKVVKNLKPEALKALNQWRKDFCRAFDADDLRTLENLSAAADGLWQRHLGTCATLRERTTDPAPVWPEADAPGRPATDTRWKDQELANHILNPAAPYRRLKLAMDYWCALWFWPIEETRLLPTRDQFLMELSVILGVTPTAPRREAQMEFESLVEVAGAKVSVQHELDFDDPFGHVNVDALCQQSERLRCVAKVALKRRFLHWELDFADLFARRGGFDLIVGNPPWVKVEWNEGGILSERNPAFAIRKLTASKIAELRGEQLTNPQTLRDYLDEYEEFEGTQCFLNALQNYPLLKGQQTNLYKCFITRAWDLAGESGGSGFLHPEGVYDDPKGGVLRRELYPRLEYHLQFQNELKLFAEVDHHAKFSINIYHSQKESANFAHLANLFSVSTVDLCFEHSGHGTPPGIKTEEGKWETAGHRDRILTIGTDTLELFARLYDAEGTPAGEARLPALHSKQLVAVLRKFADYPKRLADLGDAYRATVMWDETNAVKKDHTIRRETRFPQKPQELILSGPHFFVGNPLNKTPREVCTLNSHYDVLDLETLPDDYLPRTNYVPDCDPAEYHRRTPSVPWNPTQKVTDFYRLAFRRQLSQSGERTMIPTLVAKFTGHIHPVISFTFVRYTDLLSILASCQTIPFDFMTKTTGKGDLYESVLRQFPALQDIQNSALTRTLALNCLTTHYADLWAECWDDNFRNESWYGDDPRLDRDFWKQLTPQWTRHCALRTDYARRWALIELDVLVARALGLTLEELQTIYRIQFPVMRQYEADTWYDQNGRIVFTCSKGLPGVGFTRPEWNEIKDLQSGTIQRTVTDNTLPTGPVERTITYHPPFTRCDREQDYREVWGKVEG